MQIYKEYKYGGGEILNILVTIYDNTPNIG